MINPQATLDSSIRGLHIWWGIVFPSLLPFFILSELLISFGIVSFIGVLVEPLMRPLFRVPGIGGFVWAMGMASGFPSGAKLSATLRKQQHLTRIEAERLVSFTNSSNPLFIFGAVSVGFFHNTQLGVVLAISHYVSNMCVGFIMRFHGRKEEKHPPKRTSSFSLRTAFHVLHEKRMQETRPIGKILGDAVSSSIQTLLMIGGFIILFSVLNRMLTLIGIIPFLTYWFQYILHILSLSTTLALPLLSGIFEITLGSQLTSLAEHTPLLQQAIITSFILGFGGLSVQAQVASILADTDIRFKPYFIARIIQAFLAAFFTYILWKPLYTHLRLTIPLQEELPVIASPASSFFATLHSTLSFYGPMITITMLSLYTIMLLRNYLLLKKI
jgi:sporulation integral membrane protein YlbJ